MCFGLIAVEIVCLKDPVWSHFPLLIIHNFSSEKFSPFLISNGNYYQWEILCPPWFYYCIGNLILVCTLFNVSKTVIKLRINPQSFLSVQTLLNLQTINYLVMVPPIRWLKRCQNITLRISFNRCSFKHLKKSEEWGAGKILVEFPT